jgi:hypothetical protein
MLAALSHLRNIGDTEPRVIDRCQVKGCGASTREGKPYCSLHIENCAYIRTILAELDRRSAESATLDSGRWIACNAHLVREASLLLLQGSYTAARLARMLDITERAAAVLIRMMSRQGLVTVSFSESGAISATRRDPETHSGSA